MADYTDLIHKLKSLLSMIEFIPAGEKNAVFSEANIIAEKLVAITNEYYEKRAGTYSSSLGKEVHELDKRLWQKLIAYVNKSKEDGILKKDEHPFYMIDIATCNGRDLQYAQNELGLHAIGIDSCNAFVNQVKVMEQEGIIKKGSIFKGDMRDLSIFNDNTFDIVRHNASILHLPVTNIGAMGDKAISEAYRVLKIGGILFIYTKEGDSFEWVYTNEELEGRFYQFYSFTTLSSLLERNSFHILEITEQIEIRNSTKVPWLCAIATKNN